jgi:chromosome segregation ATPase
MKTKIVIVILAVICVGLVIGIVATKDQGDEQQKNDAAAIIDFSNQLATARTSLDDLSQVNLKLTNDLSSAEQQIEQLSNSLTQTSAELAGTKTSLQGAQDQITNLNGRIGDLEAQNKVLDDRATDLTNTIAQLNAQIADTERQLATSTTNNEFLTAELEKQMAQLAELQHRFNDLNVVRTQLKKLRDEAFVARRLELMKNSAPDQKGAQQLVGPKTQGPGAVNKKSPPNYDLNVEIGSDGSVKVIPPSSISTNTPVH